MNESDKTKRIQELALAIWQAEGRPDGQQERHWAMAERLVEAQIRADELHSPQACDSSSSAGVAE